MKQTSRFDIGLDYRMAAHTGIGTYLRRLVAAMKENAQPNSSRLALYAPTDISSGTSFSQVFFDAPIYSVREQLTYPELLNTCRLWHSPHYNVPLFKSKVKLVTTIHDIIHWKYRHTLSYLQQLYAKTMLTRAITTSDHLLTVSEYTKNDLVQFFSADPKKISVIYNGVASDFHPISDELLQPVSLLLQKKYTLPKTFFLYVGMLKPHKNVLFLIKNYLKLRAERKIECGLVIIGQGDLKSAEVQLLRASQAEIIYLPKIDYGELPLFYNLARALVHPSLYEGFGLTILEALACGTPVITTNRASLPEVGGSVAHYINGEDDEELKTALIRFDQDSMIKQRLFDGCLAQACKFSWNKSAYQTAQIYEKVLNS